MEKVSKHPYLDKLSSLDFANISTQYNFQKGTHYKIDLYHFIISYIDCVLNYAFSLQDWCNRLMTLLGIPLTKQALQAKFYERHYNSVKAVLTTLLSAQISPYLVRNWQLFAPFGRVLLQDSTCLSLCDSLTSVFPGTQTKGNLNAIARVQAIYELKQETFLDLRLQGYRDNDQKDSDSILSLLLPHDLVLRDLGYFTLANLQAIMDCNAYFVTPYRYGTVLYDQQGKQMDLHKILTTNHLNYLDCRVQLGQHHKIPLRLVAFRLNDQAAQKRIRMAKANTSQKTNHSKTYLTLLNWVIFITNVSDQIWTTKQVSFAYRVRWRIETIFKAWKSSLNFSKFMANRKMAEFRAKIQILIMLIYFTLFFNLIFASFELKVNEYLHNQDNNTPPKSKTAISLMKFANFMRVNAPLILNKDNWELIIPLILKATAYDKRNDRPNFETFIH